MRAHIINSILNRYIEVIMDKTKKVIGTTIYPAYTLSQMLPDILKDLTDDQEIQIVKYEKQDEQKYLLKVLDKDLI